MWRKKGQGLEFSTLSRQHLRAISTMVRIPVEWTGSGHTDRFAKESLPPIERQNCTKHTELQVPSTLSLQLPLQLLTHLGFKTTSRNLAAIKLNGF